MTWQAMDLGECRGEWMVDSAGLSIDLHAGSHGASITDTASLRQLRDQITQLLEQDEADMAEDVDPVPEPAAQVHYWIAEGIRAHTNMTQAEAASSTQALLDQYNAQPQR